MKQQQIIFLLIIKLCVFFSCINRQQLERKTRLKWKIYRADDKIELLNVQLSNAGFSNSTTDRFNSCLNTI